MINVVRQSLIRADKSSVVAAYLDVGNWPLMFADTIRGVSVVSKEENETVVDVAHIEGTVRNVVRVVSDHEVELREWKKFYSGRFVSRFEPVPGGTRYTLSAEIVLVRPFRPLELLLKGYVSRKIDRFAVEPLRRFCETGPDCRKGPGPAAGDAER